MSPNPLVGAVVLRDGETVAEGWHEGPGLPHAEAAALAAAGEAARGATVVCTLEPCSHHGRTPPCAAALVAAGVGRVVIGATDPLERDRAQGREVLRAAGIEVAVANGADAEACAELNAPFLTWALTGLPHVTLKLATSLDGKVATAGGEPVDLRPRVARPRAPLARRPRRRRGRPRHGDRRRPAPHRAGRGGPRAPARPRGLRLGRPPAPALALVHGAPEERLIVLAAADAPPERVAALEAAGAEVGRWGAAPPSGWPPGCGRWGSGASSRCWSRAAPSCRGARGGRAVDRVAWFLAPMLIGGREPLGPRRRRRAEPGWRRG